MEEQNLRELAVRAGRGDTDAAEDVIRAIHGRLMGYLFLLGIPRSHIDDVGQDVAFKVYRSLPRYDPSKPFLPWMKTIAHRTAANFWRSGARREKHMKIFRNYVTERVVPAESSGDLLGSQLSRLGDCVEKLQDRQREVIRLRYHEGLTATDIAARMAVKPQSIRNLLSRIRDILHACVDTAAAVAGEAR